MSTYTYEVSTEHNNYPNLTVYDRFRDGILNGWKVTANEGYVFYDENANDSITDPDTLEPIPITYYYTIRMLNPNYNWANFALVAVPRDSVPADQIFGGGDNEHEVM